MMRLLTLSALSARRAAREFNMAGSRSGSNSRSTRCPMTSPSSLSIRIERPLHALLPLLTHVEQVVAVNDAVLGGARAQGHPTPAGGAHRQTRQQDRPGCNARCDYLRTAGMKLALNLLAHLRLDHAGDRYRGDLLFRLALPRAGGGLLQLPLAHVDRVGQDPVNALKPKSVAAPGAIATAVEPFDHFFYAERARAAIPV